MNNGFKIRIEEGGRQICFEGMMRPADGRQLAEVEPLMAKAAALDGGEVTLDFKRLTHMNHVALVELSRAIRRTLERRPDIGVRLVVSSVIPWAIRRFRTLASVFPSVNVHVYDRVMYPSQKLLEHESFVQVLRAQDELVWAQERSLLERHGLRRGVRMADICCGVGGFSVWVAKTFEPKQLLAIDHSKTSLRWAQAYAKEQGAGTVEYSYGEASTLLLPDNAFDFVSCRLTLQISPTPERIVQELVRICKPGGRIYVTNELLNSCAGSPNDEAVRRGYLRLVEMDRGVGLDLNSGFKGVTLFKAAGLEDIVTDALIVDSTNSDRAKLARIFDTWGRFQEDVCDILDVEPEVRREALDGLKLHAAAALDPNGYASWPILAVSGRKPLHRA